MSIVKYNAKDIKIAIFISTFGKSFAEVLGQTFYGSIQSARNNISRMKKTGFIKLVPTGLMQPRNAVVLSSSTKRLLVDMGYTPKDARVAIGSLEHNMIEQLAYYHLAKIGTVERKSVYHHKNVYHSVPDLVVTTQAIKIFIEIEIHQKSKASYSEFVTRASQDNPDRVVYVCANTRIMSSIANAMRGWDKLFYIDIETLISNIKNFEKIKPIMQNDLLKTKRDSDKGLFSS